MDARTRLGWIRLYERVGNAGIVCRRCGISVPIRPGPPCAGAVTWEDRGSAWSDEGSSA
jgi:hypothetical protein